MFHDTEQHMDDVALMMLLDGVAAPEEAMHVAECAKCSRRASQLRGVQANLSRWLFRAACPTSLELGEYQLKMISKERTAQIERHLAGCDFCIEELAQLREFMSQPDPYLKPEPLAVAQRRVRVLVARLVGGAGQGGGFGGPALAPAFAGLRGEESGPLMYEAGDVQVLIEVEDDAKPGRKTVMGLLSDLSDYTGYTVGLWQGGQQLTLIPVDLLGNFVIEDLSEGRYELILSGPEIELHIQDLAID